MSKTVYSIEHLVRFYKHNSPVIILSGHGGNYPLNISPRTCNVPPNCDCKIGGDEYVNDIAEIVSQSLNASIVIADFDRIYIDTNRNPICAYEDPRGALNYNTFHNKIRELISEIRSKYYIAFLFDLHGTKRNDWDVYIGTINGNSIKQLLNIDPYAIERLRKLFIDKGYKFQPSYHGEKEIFQGRYVLSTYGYDTNCFQVEISTNIRNLKFASDLADIIRNFVNLYHKYQEGHKTSQSIISQPITSQPVSVTIDDIIKYADDNFISENDLKEILKYLYNEDNMIWM